MPIRMSGMASGMDTESIIKDLMTAHNLKKTKVQNKITKQEWKQEKWKDLNTKIYALYTGTLSKVKTQGSFLTKKVSTSDETKLTASASTGAVNGEHKVRVDSLASAQYVTGSALGKYTDQNGDEKVVSGGTKLVDLGFSVSGTSETMINIASGNKSATLAVTNQTTVNDFISALKSAGLNANYDTAQKRFFISSGESGIDNAFSITTSTSGDTAAKNVLRDLAGYENLTGSDRIALDNALLTYKSADSTKEEKDAALDLINEKVANQVTRDLEESFKNGTKPEEKEALDKVLAEAEQKYKDGLAEGAEVNPEELKKAQDEAVAKAASEYAEGIRKAFEEGDTNNAYYEATQKVGSALADYQNAAEDAVDIAGNTLDKLGIGEITFTKNVDGSIDYATTGSISLVKANDSVIEYNGAILTGTTNTITANGLTLNLNAVTKGTANEYISVNVSKDTQAVYDMVKGFIKEYNEILGTMNDAYNAASARGYEPLTDDEREQMSDDQIEKWENKIKDSLLRRDSTLNSLLNSMKSALQSTATYNDKTYSLASLGIRTINYTEYGKLHIYGDKDDALAAGEKDKLMAAIEEDPEMVMQVITQISTKLYETMGEKMKSSNLSSAFTFYNDKQMTKELNTYKQNYTDLEKKLNQIEDRYYKQFSAMEKAMATLNSQTNSLASMLGG